MTKRQIIAYLRKHYGLGSKIARECGVHRPVLTMWLKGKRASAKLDECVRRLIQEHMNAAQ